mmetsp:Transcript_13516/g.13094  ORF Transcript_13516/g.13094 Transcript_13516/m.13094 type:complete len:216 (-) Transcript_13516:559-1206(-)
MRSNCAVMTYMSRGTSTRGPKGVEIFESASSWRKMNLLSVPFLPRCDISSFTLLSIRVGLALTSTDLEVVKRSSSICKFFFCACCFLACARPSLSFLTFSLTTVLDINHLARPFNCAYLSLSSSSEEEEESLDDPQSLSLSMPEPESEPESESESESESLLLSESLTTAATFFATAVVTSSSSESESESLSESSSESLSLLSASDSTSLRTGFSR